jgi:hypothetical protein
MGLIPSPPQRRRRMDKELRIANAVIVLSFVALFIAIEVNLLEWVTG